ncbi:hypothetical protein Tco_0649943 [Tanacetum coccineum]
MFSRPARSILTLKPLPTIDPKDKGKGVLKESPVKKVKRTKNDASEELAARLQIEEREREREMYIIEERSKLLAEFFERRKKLLAEERVAAVRNKPPTRTQLRSLMMTFLKHTDKQLVWMRKRFPEEPESTKVEVKQEGREENIMNKLDFNELHRLQRFSTTTPKGIDLVLWGDLRIMFEETKEDLFKNKLMSLGAKMGVRRIFECWFSDHTTNGHQFTMSNRHQELASQEANGFCKELASPKQTALGKDISNPLIVGEDCWVLEDFTTYCCWFNIGAASEDLVLLRKIEENRLSL